MLARRLRRPRLELLRQLLGLRVTLYGIACQFVSMYASTRRHASSGIGRWKVYEMMATGELPTIRIGRLVRVPRVALERWIEEHTSTGQAA